MCNEVTEEEDPWSRTANNARPLYLLYFVLGMCDYKQTQLENSS